MKCGSKLGPCSPVTREKLRQAMLGRTRGGKRPKKPRQQAPSNKVCVSCGEEKKISEFSPHAQMADGHLNQCRGCRYEYVKQWLVRRWGDITTARRVNYERQIELGSIKRQAPQKYGRDQLARKRAVLRYTHKRRSRTRSSTELDLFVFDEAMRLCQQRNQLTGGRWSIDHIVPLHGRNVSGLHNACNLQVVPLRWNELKKNLHMDPYWPMVPTGVERRWMGY